MIPMSGGSLKLPIWLLYFTISLSRSTAFYDMLNYKTFHVSGLKDNAVFGFSVSSVASGPNAKLVVGAPQEDNIGGVYVCDINTEQCSKTDSTIPERSSFNVSYDDHKYWHGATVAGGDQYFVTCAPLSLSYDKVFKGNAVAVYGQCYSYEYPTWNRRNLPTIPATIREDSVKKHEDLMDTLGWSVYIDDDRSILAGGPGMTSGRLIKLKPSNDKPPIKYEVFHVDGKRCDVKYNYGYSVVSGYFMTSTKVRRVSTNSMVYAVASTYGSDGRGMVIIQSSDITMPAKKTILSYSTNTIQHHEGVGWMFGASLCAATLDGRKKAYLLVGAPGYTDPTTGDYNTGAVFVYTALSDSIEPMTVINAKNDDKYFGAAMINVGDINGDKQDEIAIAAPYTSYTSSTTKSESSGIVYIYSGAHIADKGRNTPCEPMQILTPESSIRSFGYSLGMIRDYDDNGCNELVIGAPESNKVVVYRCAAIIKVTLQKLPGQIPKTVVGDETKIIPLCFTAEFPDKPNKLYAEIKVTIDIHQSTSSVMLQDPANGILTFKITNKLTTQFCRDIKLTLKATGDYGTPLPYDITMSLLKDPLKTPTFSPENVLLSVDSISSVSGSIWVQECGNKKCQPNLSMLVTYSEKSPYMIGSSKSIDATVSVENAGDVAYDACLRVTLSGAEVARPPAECRALDHNQLQCAPKQHLRKNWALPIKIDTTKLTNEDKDTSISMGLTLYNKCNIEQAGTPKNMTLQLTADINDIEVQGRTDEGYDNFVNLTKLDIERAKQFHHVYTIRNRGPTNWVNVPIYVTVAKLPTVTSSVYNVLKNQECSLDTTLAIKDYNTYRCPLTIIEQNSFLEVQVTFTTVSATLYEEIEKANVTVNSKLTVLNSKSEVKSELRLIVVEVPIWVIIAASILAFILLVIIFLILRECGYLKRQGKEDLKRQRQSVRRQTMMRKSTAERSRPRSDDQDMLVEDLEYEQPPKKDRRVVVKG